MSRVAVNLIVALAFLAGVVLLQVYLSRREGKWPGLALPILAFLFGLLYPLNMIAPAEGAVFGWVLQLLAVWLLGNIPTIILLAIYFSCREKKRRNRQLEKMHIQDLD